MRKEIKVKQNTVQKDVKRKSNRTVQILVVLLVLGFLWVAGKGILYLYNFIISRL
ncbi:MAG: hypothetical protein OER74_14685 [Desulfobacteraceae bacterium]|nr:hypothetical protein [Desulfobacteraceae bacterium]